MKNDLLWCLTDIDNLSHAEYAQTIQVQYIHQHAPHVHSMTMFGVVVVSAEYPKLKRP